MVEIFMRELGGVSLRGEEVDKVLWKSNSTRIFSVIEVYEIMAFDPTSVESLLYQILNLETSYSKECVIVYLEVVFG